LSGRSVTLGGIRAVPFPRSAIPALALTCPGAYRPGARAQAVNCHPVTGAVIRRASDADLMKLARLRREWTREEKGDQADPGFEDRFAAWYAQETSRRIVWLAEAGGHRSG
jgi:hypothetical protein